MEPLAKKTSPKKSLIYFASIFIPFAWGTTFVFLKDIVETTDPNLLIFYRFGIAAIILGIFTLFKKISLFKNLKIGITLGLVLWLAFASQFFGLKYTNIVNSAFITGMFVIFIPFLEKLLNNHSIKMKHLLAVAISLIGLWYLTGGVKNINTGDLLTIITALTVAAHVAFTDKFMKQGLNPLVVNFQQMLICSLLSLCLFLFFGSNLDFRLTKPNLYSILYLAFIPTVGAYLAQLWVQQYASAMTISLFFNLEPVFAILFAFLYKGYVLSTQQIIGSAIIILAVVSLEISFPKFRPYLYGTAGK